MPDTDARSSEPPKLPSGRKMFLERRVYQRRRLIDATKLLPLAGLAIFVVPALLLGSPGAEGASGGGTTALRLIYFLVVWACLIVANAVITRGLSDEDGPDADLPPTTERAADP